MSASNDTFIKTIFVAITLCLFCSVLVSGTAVSLKEQQKGNALADKKRNVLIAANLYKEGVDVTKAFENIEQKFVDMETGKFVEIDNPESFDQRKSAKELSTSIAIENDLARIGRRSKVVPVYLVKANNKVETIILPVHGKGLFSTMYGFVALKSDKETVVGLKFYEQGETPGLGGEIDNPNWLSLWPGKKVIESGKPAVKLVKTGAKNDYEVDALSGATMTTRGVQNMLDYWLGQDGYATFLSRLDVSRGEA
jgi:Na+-transporting NADH:ubiquinone oxidoreductase subunit C